VRNAIYLLAHRVPASILISEIRDTICQVCCA
jgi:hypothetical protein